jgi:hypothetical protein
MGDPSAAWRCYAEVGSVRGVGQSAAAGDRYEVGSEDIDRWSGIDDLAREGEQERRGVAVGVVVRNDQGTFMAFEVG